MALHTLPVYYSQWAFLIVAMSISNCRWGFLLGLSKNDDLRAGLRFKGGTCLRKCYFPENRFSEDLDFTMEKYLSASAIETHFQQIASWVTEQNGPNFQVEPVRFEVVDDEYGNESYQARVY
jgi:predicted nucleotidyltransferase component of viral defense system